MRNLLQRDTLTRVLVHDAEFRQAEKDWYSLVQKLTEKLMDIDDTIPELPVKDVVHLPATLVFHSSH